MCLNRNLQSYIVTICACLFHTHSLWWCSAKQPKLWMTWCAYHDRVLEYYKRLKHTQDAIKFKVPRPSSRASGLRGGSAMSLRQSGSGNLSDHLPRLRALCDVDVVRQPDSLCHEIPSALFCAMMMLPFLVPVYVDTYDRRLQEIYLIQILQEMRTRFSSSARCAPGTLDTAGPHELVWVGSTPAAVSCFENQ